LDKATLKTHRNIQTPSEIRINNLTVWGTSTIIRTRHRPKTVSLWDMMPYR